MFKKYVVEILGICFAIGVITGVSCYSQNHLTFLYGVIQYFFTKGTVLSFIVIIITSLLITLVYRFFYLHGYSSITLCCFAFTFGLLISGIHIYFEPQTAEKYVGRKVLLRGTVREDADVRETSVRLSIAPRFIEQKTGKEESKTKKENETGKVTVGEKEAANLGAVLVVADKDVDYEYGDELEVAGVLELPENILSDDGRVFNYVGYLRAKHIKYVIKNAKVKVISKNNGINIIRFLYAFKNKFISSLRKLLPEPHSSLAGGILLGEKSALGKDTEDAFRRSGLIHIVVLSGFNVSIVAVLLMSMFSSFGKRTSVVLGIISLALFSVMVGGGATVIRSAVMAGISFLAPLFKSKYDVLRALTISAIIMLIQNPLIIIYDPSFQLSFMATLGLLIFSNALKETVLKKVPEKFEIKEMLASTFSAQIIVTPLILYMTGQFSVIAPLTNILVLPFMSVAMLLVFLTGFLGLFSVYISTPVSWFAYAVLEYVLSVVKYGSSIKYSAFKVPKLSLWVILILYIFVVIFAIALNRYSNKKKLKEIISKL